ncbi:MAG: S9 family peptidase [Actinomycetota bacterium]
MGRVSEPSDSPATPSPFADLAAFVALPRVAGLALSADGRRLAVAVQTLDAERKKWQSALWEVDPEGRRPARRLTRSAPGESAPVWAPDGSLLFTSTRPDPEAGSGSRAGGAAEEPKRALWSLPADGGEARPVLSHPGGIGTVSVAADTGEVVVTAAAMPGATDAGADAELRKRREDAGVTAVLHEAYPVRHWDADLGPATPHLFWVGALPADPDAGAERPAVELRDLTPDAVPPSGAGDDLHLSPDGRLLVRVETVPDGPAARRQRLLLVETATGASRALVDDPLADLSAPRFSPDGRAVVCVRESMSTHDDPPDYTLLHVDVATGAARELTPGFDRWPSAPQFAADGTTVYFLADDGGRHALFRVPADGGEPVRMTTDGAYSDLQVARDGSALYALRSAYDEPPGPVRLDPRATGQHPEPLPHPGALGALPGSLHEVEATAADGTPVHSWLVLPEGASAEDPAPLLLWIHGGPLMSWNSWSWRWCPWVMAARGYAVLLPDPALSQGYGQDFVRRGWGTWGEAPYTDLMAAVDAVEQRPDVDRTRTAAMGGSFGGYMANWVAGQTDRFRCVITHASIWSLEQFHGTTDHAAWWEREFGSPEAMPERYRDHSPDRNRARVRTPMLVIHGERDHRVPIGEALRLWSDLTRLGVEARFLYFPEENHWILTPPHVRVWYETVLAFLDQHVLGKDWVRPELL